MRIFLFGVLYSTAWAANFINPPASNVFSSPKTFPVYKEGDVIELIWTANSSYRPLRLALRTSTDAILQPESNIHGAILSDPNANSTEWTVTTNLDVDTYYLMGISRNKDFYFTSSFFNISRTNSGTSTTTSSTSTSTTTSSSSSTTGPEQTPTLPGNATSISPTATSEPAKKSSDAVPIVVGVAVPTVAILVGALAFFFWKRRSKRRAQAVDGLPGPNPKSGLEVGSWGNSNGGPANYYFAPKAELDAGMARAEMDGAENDQRKRKLPVHGLG